MVRIRIIKQARLCHILLRYWLLLCLSLGVAIQASAASLLLVPSQSAQPYLQVVERLVEELRESRFTFHITPAAALNRPQLQQHQLVITLGIAALERALALEGNSTILAAMVPRDSFTALTQAPSWQRALRQGRLSAIYLEQPYWRQLRLARAIAPRAKRLGALLGPHSAAHQAELLTSLDEYGWQSTLTPMGEHDNPLSVIRRLVANSDLLLAVPDRADFNRNTARWLLMLSLREKVPLIGYSQRYVEAGAVASVFSSPLTIAAEAAAWAVRWRLDSPQQLPPPDYPRLFDISLNPDIAARLQLQLPSPSQLQQALQWDATP